VQKHTDLVRTERVFTCKGFPPAKTRKSTRDRLLKIINECESHRDQMIDALMTRYRHFF
jgi:hypothetical protein